MVAYMGNPYFVPRFWDMVFLSVYLPTYISVSVGAP